jgi:hypothetical protein
MYVKSYIVARSRKYCCHENATIRCLFIVLCVDVAVNNIQVLIVAMEMQKWVPFTLSSRYKIFRTAVNNKYYIF